MECGYCLLVVDDISQHLKTCKQRKYLIKELFNIDGITIKDVAELMWRIFKSPNKEEIIKSNKIIYEEGLDLDQLLHL